MTHRVLVGVDGSPHSGAALRWALSEAAARSGEVIALLSWQMPFIGVPGGFSRQEVEQAARDLLLASVAEVAEVAARPRVPLRPILAEGDPTESLIEASKGADLLVLGIRGRSPFAGLMLGSVSQACAAHAACPVVLVKRSDPLGPLGPPEVQPALPDHPGAHVGAPQAGRRDLRQPPFPQTHSRTYRHQPLPTRIT